MDFFEIYFRMDSKFDFQKVSNYFILLFSFFFTDALPK